MIGDDKNRVLLMKAKYYRKRRLEIPNINTNITFLF